MNDEINIWEFMAFTIADAVAKAANVKLSWDMVQAAEEQLHLINEGYIVRVYFATIDPATMKEISDRMKKLINDKLGKGLSSGFDVILSKDDKHD
jgi:hypothetical protein